MSAICKSDVATISDTEKDRINPAAVERRITSRDVWKKRQATSEIAIQPTIPLISADFLNTISMSSMMTMGNNVHASGMRDI
jgi:hypothetical protein